MDAASARAEVGIEEKTQKGTRNSRRAPRSAQGALSIGKEGLPCKILSSTLAQAREAFENRMADELTEAHIEDHIAAQQRKDKKPATIKQSIGNRETCLPHCEGCIAGNPASARRQRAHWVFRLR